MQQFAICNKYRSFSPSKTVSRPKYDRANYHESQKFGQIIVALLAVEQKILFKLTINCMECGPTLNVMVALPNIGGALCSTPQSLADAHHLSAV